MSYLNHDLLKEKNNPSTTYVIVIILLIVFNLVCAQVNSKQQTDNSTQAEEEESIDSQTRRGILSAFGQLLQATALSLVDLSQKNLSFKARIKEISYAFLLLIIGSVCVGVSGEKRLDGWFTGITVIIIRIDAVVNLIAGIVRMVDWYKDTQEEDMWYESQIWPLQAAVSIWKDCKEVQPMQPNVNDKSALLDMVESRLQALATTKNTRIPTRLLRLPFYIFILLILLIVHSVEFLFDKLFGILSKYKVINKTPIKVYGEDQKYLNRLMMGHTILVTDEQLDWVTNQIQAFLLQQDTDKQSNEKQDSSRMKRILVNSIHISNLLGGKESPFRRLNEHSVLFRGMNWYYSQCFNTLYKKMLETNTLSDLKLFENRPSGNNYRHGEEATGQMLWGRILLGRIQLENQQKQSQQNQKLQRQHQLQQIQTQSSSSLQLLQQQPSQSSDENLLQQVSQASQLQQQQQQQQQLPAYNVQWLPKLTNNIYEYAQELSKFVDEPFSRQGIGRHVYSVTRRWLVDYIMFLWWRDDLECNDTKNDINYLVLKQIFIQNQKHNTKSLPHALGYLLAHQDVSGMLLVVLGDDYEQWAQNTLIDNQQIVDVIKQQPIWQSKKETLDKVSISQELYQEVYLQDYLQIESNDIDVLDKIRIAIVDRVVDQIIYYSLR